MTLCLKKETAHFLQKQIVLFLSLKSIIGSSLSPLPSPHALPEAENTNLWLGLLWISASHLFLGLSPSPLQAPPPPIPHPHTHTQLTSPSRPGTCHNAATIIPTMWISPSSLPAHTPPGTGSLRRHCKLTSTDSPPRHPLLPSLFLSFFFLNKIEA